MHFAWNCSYPIAAGESLRDFVRLGEVMEATGFRSFLYGEHVLMPRRFDRARYPYLSFPADNAWPDVFALLAAVAMRTTTLRLCTSVMVVPYHSPAVLAQSVATVDALSDGRLVFGAGVGWMQEEFEALGVPFTERGARTTESIRLMQALWTGTEPDIEPRFYTIPRGTLQPAPVQKPHPPIAIGGEGTAAMKRVAAYGSGWQFYYQPPGQLRATLAELSDHMEAAGRSLGEIELCMACDAVQMIEHPEQVAELEALGIHEIIIRPEYDSIGAALRDCERLARALIRS